MLKQIIATAALGLVLVAGTGASQSADARGRGGGGGGGASFGGHAGAGFASSSARASAAFSSAGARFSVGARSGFAGVRVAAVTSRPAAFVSERRGHHRRRGPLFAGFVSGPAVYGYVAYADAFTDSYANGCAWIRRVAIETGSRRWWQSYYDCRDDD